MTADGTPDPAVAAPAAPPSPQWAAAPVPEAAATLREEGGFAPWLAALLARRGVATARDAKLFLHPDLEQLHSASLLQGLAPAVERLAGAADRGETVAVVGDYDVDGVTATALLTAVLGAAGLAVEPILPHRMAEGYGFQPAHVERARKLGCRLLVTADCGTSSHEAVAAAHEAGLEVIVTDHHLPGEPLPGPVIQINPKQPGCAYPFKDLAACGIAFKLAAAFAEARGLRIEPEVLLRVACLGTIADMVPLLGENRVIAAIGLRALADTRSAGLRALMEQARLQPPLQASDVGFRIGPRINAAGRMDSADKALELLLTRDPARAEELARTLEGWNRERQATESRVVEEAREAILARPALAPILVAWSEGWHRGVIGIAAGRLAREFHRPTILFGVDGGTAVGSGRSIQGVHLHRFIDGWRERLERFGGHAQAIGLEVSAGALEALRLAWEAAAGEWDEALLQRRRVYEAQLAPGEVGAELLRDLSRLEPFGVGNPRPLIRVGPLRPSRPPRFFGRGHAGLYAAGDDGSEIEMVGWGWEERAKEIAGRFEVLGHLEYDRYRKGPVLRLVDARLLSAG